MADESNVIRPKQWQPPPIPFTDFVNMLGDFIEVNLPVMAAFVSSQIAQSSGAENELEFYQDREVGA